jgi:NADPH:quinone reductase-like Zn-dependent oxidoreductase
VASGATVIAISSSDEKLKTATKLGAKHVINYKTTPDWAADVVKLTNGLGVDRVVEVQ